MDMHTQWNKLAIELGFRLERKIRPLVELPSLHKMAARAVKTGDIHKAEKWLEHPMMANLLSKAFVGSATGLHRGYEFAVFPSSVATSSSKPAYYVNVVLLLKGNYQFGLEIYRSGFFSKIGKALRAGTYVKISENKSLDKAIAVRAKDKEHVRGILSDTLLQERLANLYAFSKDFQITDRDIRYHERGTIIDKEKAIRIMDAMVGVAERFPAEV